MHSGAFFPSEKKSRDTRLITVWTGFFPPLFFFSKNKRGCERGCEKVSITRRPACGPGLWASLGRLIRQEAEKIHKLVWQSWKKGHTVCKEENITTILKLWKSAVMKPFNEWCWRNKRRAMKKEQPLPGTEPEKKLNLQLKVFWVHTLQFRSVSNIWTVTVPE